MKKWYQKSMAVLTAAVCLFAGGTIGLARDSLPQLQLTAEAANTYIGAAYGLQLEYEELNDGTVEITKFVSSSSTDIELPSVIDGKSVTSIGGRAFNAYDIEACKNLTSIIIPDSVTRIGDDAFYKCTSLTSITIPDSVTNIGEGAFGSCTSLTEITIPDSVTFIDWGAFSDCTDLTIYGYTGSYAETYAKENDIPFVSLGNITTTETTTTTIETTVTTKATTTTETDTTEATSTTKATTTTETNTTEATATTKATTTTETGTTKTTAATKVTTTTETGTTKTTAATKATTAMETDTTETTVTTKTTTTTTITTEATTTTKQDSETPTVIYGDITLDGRVDITDAVLLNKFCSGAVILNDAAKLNSDCDGDGDITGNDAVALLQFLVQIVQKLPYTA